MSKKLFKCFEKIAVTVDQLAAANDRMYGSTGAVHGNEIISPIYKRLTASALEGGYKTNPALAIPAETLTEEARNRLRQHGHTHGIIINEPDPKKGDAVRIAGADADPNFEFHFPDTVKMIRNWAKNHELREIQNSNVKRLTLNSRLTKHIENPGNPPKELETGPKSLYEKAPIRELINAGSLGYNPYAQALREQLRFSSHNSPRLTLQDIRLAATAGKDSDQAKKFLGGSHDPADKATAREFKSRFQADDMNLGPHVLQARLAAKKAGDPNWRSVTSSDPAVSAARTAIRGSYDTPSMANFRAVVQNARDREMHVLREALPDLASQLEQHHKPGTSEYEKPSKELINETIDSWAALPYGRRLGFRDLEALSVDSGDPISDILRDKSAVDKSMNQGEADALAARRRLKDDFLDVNKSVQTYLRSLKGYRRSERKILGQDTSPNNPMPVRQRALDALLKLDENKPPSNVVHEVHNLPTTEPEYRPRSRKFRRRR